MVRMALGTIIGMAAVLGTWSFTSDILTGRLPETNSVVITEIIIWGSLALLSMVSLFWRKIKRDLFQST